MLYYLDGLLHLALSVSLGWILFYRLWVHRSRRELLLLIVILVGFLGDLVCFGGRRYQIARSNIWSRKALKSFELFRSSFWFR